MMTGVPRKMHPPVTDHLFNQNVEYHYRIRSNIEFRIGQRFQVDEDVFETLPCLAFLYGQTDAIFNRCVFKITGYVWTKPAFSINLKELTKR